MISAAIPENEEERLAELQRYQILDTVDEDAYDAITFLVSQICQTPIALISIVDSDRQWFKSRVGIEDRETPRDVAFCAHGILNPAENLIVFDAFQDERFRDNPLVTDHPGIRFYAGAPLVTSSGNALGMLCAIDREPRKLDEGQIGALEALAVQVVALLDLRLALREVEEETRKREQFMSMVSHEIRTPLTAIMGYLEILSDPEAGLSDIEKSELLGVVNRQATEVEKLTEDFLTLSRAESGTLRVLVEEVDPMAETRKAIESMEKENSVEIENTDRVKPVSADPFRLRQIVRNLLTNSFRYGEPPVRIRIIGEEDRVHLQVIDHGKGIPEEEREVVFRPFGQGSNARHVPTSVGLGLAISRLLAEAMGGELTYEHVEGLSVMDLTLPVFRTSD